MSEIKNNWKVFPVYDRVLKREWADQRINIRCIDPNRKLAVINRIFKSLDYASDQMVRESVESFVMQKNALGYNVYQCVNEINYDFNGDAVSDCDIFALDKLFIDIDRASATRNPATNDELKSAWKFTCKVKSFLSSLDWPNPNIVMSGNGYHLYYLFDDDMLNPSSENQQYVRRVLNYLAYKFDTPNIKVDRNVFNPGRITKVIGTIARKGIESSERPYRRVTLIEKFSPGPTQYVSKTMIESLIGSHKSTNKCLSHRSTSSRIESPREIAILEGKLKFIDPSCDRSIWLKVVFSILSTGWVIAEEIALEWSKGSPDKFVLGDFERVVGDYRSGREGYGNKTITIATLHHYALQGGWHG